MTRPSKPADAASSVDENTVDLRALEAAIGRIVDGEPLPGDAAIVVESLASSPEVVEQLEQHLLVDALLRDEVGYDAAAFVDAVRVMIEAENSRPAFVTRVREAIFGKEADFVCPIGPAATTGRRRWAGLSLPITLACTLLVMSLLANGIWNAAAIGEPVMVEVAAVDGTTAFTVGDRLDLRTLVLPDGEVDLMLGSGVRLECQAPLMARFEHPMRLHLSRGRIDIDVGDDGAGFTVVTSAGEVVDLGTRFSVNASPDGEVRVAVFSGQVELRSQQVGAVSLVDGEAVRLTKSQAPRRLQSVEIRSRNPGDRKAVVISEISDNVEVSKLRRFYGLVACGMRDGVRAFRDRREVSWQAEPGDVFPDDLYGADLVQTFQAERFRQDFNLQFGVSQPSRVYVFYDARYSPPDWLARDFVNTGRRIVSTGWSPTPVTRGVQPDVWGTLAIPHDIWCRDLVQPTTVVLGPPVLPERDRNSTSQFESFVPSMYGIAVQPIAPPATNIGFSRPRPSRAKPAPATGAPTKAVPVATRGRRGRP